MTSLRILIIGDRDESATAHRANPHALVLAARTNGCDAQADWPGTVAIADGKVQLSRYDAFWCVPASPYASTEGALTAIRYARENAVPFLGTCGGFQHALLEFARNVLALPNSAHEEMQPDAETPLIARLACSLVEVSGRIFVSPDSFVGRLLPSHELNEEYHCSFGLNPDYIGAFAASGLRFVGADETGDPRLAELAGHPFFVLTLFQPERAALRGVDHPIVSAFIRAALAARALPDSRA